MQVYLGLTGPERQVQILISFIGLILDGFDSTFFPNREQVIRSEPRFNGFRFAFLPSQYQIWSITHHCGSSPKKVVILMHEEKFISSITELVGAGWFESFAIFRSSGELSNKNVHLF